MLFNRKPCSFSCSAVYKVLNTFRTPLLYNPVQAKKDTKAAERIADVMDTLKLAADGFHRIQDCISRQVEACDTQVRALRLRGGLSSLPDEILAIVLEYATTTPFDIYEEGNSAILFTRAAITLSHICQRFRFLMVRISSLWSRIFNGMKYRLVSALCVRMTMPTAEIILEETKLRSRTNPEKFLRTVAPRSELWRRFVHGQINSSFSTDGTSEASKELKMLARVTNHLHAPFLAELVICHKAHILPESHNQDVHDSFHYYSTWFAPRLRSLTMCNLVPVPFAGSTTLTYFKCGLEYFGTNRGRADLDFSGLIQFLLSCPVLKSFSLKSFCLTWPETVASSLGNPVKLASIDTLDFGFSSCESSLIRAFLDAARFPNVITMKLNIMTGSITEPADVLCAVLPDSIAFPHLNRLHLRIHAGRTGKLPAIGTPTVWSPFFNQSNIQHLTIFEDFFMGALPDGPFLPVLRSLTFNNCSFLERHWVTQLLGRLKEQGIKPKLTVVTLPMEAGEPIEFVGGL